MGNNCLLSSRFNRYERPVDEVELVSVKTNVKSSVTETMDCSNLEDIKSRFAYLLTCVKSALEANHVSTNDVHSVLVGMFPGSDKYIPNTNLDEIFRAATRHEHWNYWHHSPVEKLLSRFLGADHLSLMREYKEHLSGFYTTAKLINYMKYMNIDRHGSNEFHVNTYTREQCQKLMIKLEIERNITNISLKYIQDLWERFAEEFRIPYLTAVVDSVVIGSLIITWLVPRDVAEKIATAAHKFTSFFRKHNIISATITAYGDKVKV